MIWSHDPLKDCIINQTGKTPEKRLNFLNNMWKKSKAILIHADWKTDEVGENPFKKPPYLVE